MDYVVERIVYALLEQWRQLRTIAGIVAIVALVLTIVGSESLWAWCLSAGIFVGGLYCRIKAGAFGYEAPWQKRRRHP